MAARLIGRRSRVGGNAFPRLPVLGSAVLAAMLAGTLGGCMGTATPAAATLAPIVSASPGLAIQQARSQVEAALRGAGFALIDARQPYRPPETAAIAAAPRAVYQIVLPADPDRGQLVVYDLGSAASAASLGRDFAAYLASGPVLVEFPPDTRFVLRQLGSTLVLFTWSQASSPDASGGRAADALETIGQGIVVR